MADARPLAEWTARLGEMHRMKQAGLIGERDYEGQKHGMLASLGRLVGNKCQRRRSRRMRCMTMAATGSTRVVFEATAAKTAGVAACACMVANPRRVHACHDVRCLAFALLSPMDSGERAILHHCLFISGKLQP